MPRDRLGATGRWLAVCRSSAWMSEGEGIKDTATSGKVVKQSIQGDNCEVCRSLQWGETEILPDTTRKEWGFRVKNPDEASR